MTQNVFAPKLVDSEEVAAPTGIVTSAVDPTSKILLTIIRSAVVGFAFLLPVFFLPGLWTALGFQKVMLVLVVLAVVVVIGGLLILRSRESKTVLPLSLLSFVGLVVVACISALFSAEPMVGIRGSVLGPQTVSFLVLLFGVMCVPLVLQNAKRFTLLTLIAFGSGVSLLLGYVVLRLFAGPILNLGSFTAVTQTPAGNFNDVALIAGLTIITSIVTLLQLPLRYAAKIALTVAVALSLIVLAVVNFFYVWLVVGFFALLILLYLLSKDMLFASEETAVLPRQNLTVTALAIVICLASATYIVAGDYVGGVASNWFEVDYLEVRPSFGATTDIAKAVYQDNLLLGVGPNQFASAWRQYKDPSINQTIFWSTDFAAGSGFVATLFVTLGLLGGLALVGFHLLYLWYGIRMLIKPALVSSFWYFVGVVSFSGAVFLWAMTYVYVPGATVLFMAAFLTGISFVARGGLYPDTVKTVPLVINQKRGFALMAVVLLLITGSVFTVYTVGAQYYAQTSFNKAQASAESVDTIDQAAMFAYNQYPDDRFLGIRARVALLEMNRLLSVQEPTDADRDRFLEVGGLAITFARAAIAAAPQNPEYHAILAGIYNNYSIVGEAQALDLAKSSLAEAVRLDPHNPTYALVEAQMAAARGDVVATRAALQTALTQKQNFTEALYLLAQLDIAEEDTEAAIATTRAIITLEPQNPTRYYQLGILLTADKQLDLATEAYQTALALDPGYANARYLLALLQVERGETEQALTELRIVEKTNPENEGLRNIIAALESGEYVNNASVVDPQVSEAAPAGNGSEITSPVSPDTDLITPLNTVPTPEVVTAPLAEPEGDTAEVGVTPE